MSHEHEVMIDGDADAVWKLVAGAHSWPDLIPHIRSVDHCSWTNNGEIVRIVALRYQIPVRSRCLLATIREERCFRAFYLDGVAGGLVETWLVRDHGRGLVRLAVSIDSWRGRRSPAHWIARRWLAAPLVKHRLKMIALLAEADYLARSDSREVWRFDPATSSLQDSRDDVG